MGTSNSKLPRVIIWEGVAVISYLLHSSLAGAQAFKAAPFFTNLSKLMSTFAGAKKPIS